jgi:hypothetical protein
MAADPSSAPAASTPVGWTATAAFAALSASPMSAKSPAAEVIMSGVIATYDIAAFYVPV